MGKVRIQNVMYSENGVYFRVNVWDENYTGTTVTSFESNGFELEYDRVDRFITPLVPSSVYYHLVDDDSASFINFKAALATAQENRFKLYIEKWTAGAWVIYWAGVIMTDMVSWNNEPAPRDFEIVAKDGLNRLEKIVFDKLGSSPYYDGTRKTSAKIIKIIFDCLSYSGTAQFWNGSSKPYITCDATWHDTLQTSVTQADILSYIQIGTEFLIEDPQYNEDYTTVTFRGATDVGQKVKNILTDILQLWALRLIQSDGSWHIQQVSIQDYASVSIGTYDYLGAYVSATTQTIRKTHNGGTLAVLAGGKFGYYPPVRLTKAQIYPSTILQGFYSISKIVSKTDTNYPTAALSFTSATFQIGNLYGGTNLKLHFNLNYFIWVWSHKVGKDFYIHVTFKLVAGSNRIHNKYAIAAPRAGGDVEWTTTSADLYAIDIYYAAKQTGSQSIQKSVQVETPDIPFGQEDNCTLVVTAELKSVSGNTNWPGVSDLQVYFKNVEIIVLDTSKSPPEYAQITEIEKVNASNPANTSNSIEIDYGLLRIADCLGTTPQASFNTIQVNQPNNAGALTPSTTWVAGYPTDEDLVSTLLKETLALQRTPIQKYTGSFRSTIYEALCTILYDSMTWVFMGGRYSQKTDTWDCEWFGIAQDFTTDPVSTTRANDKNGIQWSPGGYQRPFDPTIFLPAGPSPLGTMAVKIDEGTVLTNLDINQIAYRHIRSGDVIYLLNSNIMEKVQAMTVTSDIEIGDVAVPVSSTTAAEDLWQSFILSHDPREIVASNILRGDYLQLQKHLEQGISPAYNQIWQLKTATTGATPTTMTMDGLAISGVTNIPSIPDDAAFAGIVHITAKKQNTADCAYFIRQFLAYNDSGTSALEGAVQTIGTDIIGAGIVGLAVTVTVDDTSEGINVDVTGIGGQNFQWSAQLLGVISVYA